MANEAVPVVGSRAIGHRFDAPISNGATLRRDPACECVFHVDGQNGYQLLQFEITSQFDFSIDWRTVATGTLARSFALLPVLSSFRDNVNLLGTW